MYRQSETKLIEAGEPHGIPDDARICSGQNRKPGGKAWGWCSSSFPCWRPETTDCKRWRTWRTPEAAQRALDAARKL